ncbi:TolC family protein [Flammeovirga kamogawensis]|uniref:TolC family protein n=1 Tax=Flammeovirga kamogawensis TaxID=373891 RepID=A0ABX8GRH5_9BACT|nr:TolC family protein [Flammeovirga kamogawensis]MBB6462133.1 NodT family efflux transporter outer membrane factor (OMF) lipoprotein [Flammeovirga kamogawensis]QWG05867.1 TolC family protein [Flammeovirga kamogawensis]TRX67691.1 TolC family protein [Flammeovirga kamogawensis]
MKLLTKIGLTLGATLAFSGCIKLKDAPTSDEIKEDNTALENMKIPNDWVFQEMDSAQVDLSWAKEWETTEIDSIIAEGYKYNADINIAASRIEQANKGLKIAKSRLLPIIGAGGSAGYNFPTQGAAPGYGMVNMSWEVDLWGKLRYAKKGTETMIYSAEYAQQKLEQVLAASIAKAWYTAVFIKQQKDLVNQAIVATEKMTSLNEARFAIGAAKESDVLQMNAQEAKFREKLIELEQVEKDTKRSIELLVGRYPKGEIEVAAALPELKTEVPENLPMSMLENRPEIMISQYSVQQAFYNKEVAKAARWPKVSINSSFGGVNSTLQSMMHLSNPIFSLGTSLTTPIFSWGAIKANIAIQDENQKQAVLYYAKSYLNALSEVETSLNGIDAVEDRFEQSSIALENLERTYELSELQYKIGNENMFTLLQKQLQLLNEGTNQLNLKYQKISQRINLYLALGGDYVDVSAS